MRELLARQREPTIIERTIQHMYVHALVDRCDKLQVDAILLMKVLASQ